MDDLRDLPIRVGIADASFDGAYFNPAKLSDPANQYFNPKAFANPAYGELGTGPARLSSLRGFGGAYEDLGIIKDIRFGRYTAQVKFELINVLNRHYFADPETNVGSPYFSQVTSLGGKRRDKASSATASQCGRSRSM